MTFELG